VASPVEQFELKPLIPIEIGGVDLSFTNSALFMALAVVAAAVFLTQSMRGRQLVPNRWQSMAELSYEFIANMVREQVGNLLGMVPYAYTFTSQIIVTFAMATAVFIGVTAIAIVKHGVHFLGFFFPAGAPIYMAPLLIPIEILSYLSRPISLSVRLFANMMAGHTMMKVFGGFVVALGVFGVAPMLVLIALTGFEILVAVLQAYVFTILTCIYLRDALHLHH
jgi:F-type H+-transporting ATPase subunit a